MSFASIGMHPFSTLLGIALIACSIVAFTPNGVLASGEAPQLSEYSDEILQRLIGKYSSANGEEVDYAAWQSSAEDMAALDEQVAIIAAISPDTQPGLFANKADERRYWINSYNALVLDAVLDYWPLESVRHVKLSLSSRLIPGKGFFYDREVIVGGKKTNLLKLEKALLREQNDPRLHFALNCASGSCPVLRPSNWTEEELEQASRDFVNHTDNVRVQGGTVYLSEIFDWYEDDFPPDLFGYLQQFAEPALAAKLATASAEKYKKQYREYDWSLNDGSDADIFSKYEDADE